MKSDSKQVRKKCCLIALIVKDINMCSSLLSKIESNDENLNLNLNDIKNSFNLSDDQLFNIAYGTDEYYYNNEFMDEESNC